MTAAEGGGSKNVNVVPGFLGWANMSEHSIENEAGCAVCTKYQTVPLPRLL